MTWSRVRSSWEVAARTAMVLPAPTSPQMTPRAASAMQKPMRAMASAWAVRLMRSRAAMRLVKGVLAKPKWATQGAGGVEPAVAGSLGVGVIMEVIAAPGLGRWWWAGRRLGSGVPGRAGWVWVGRPGDGGVGVAADHQRGGDAGRGAVDEHGQAGEVFWVVAQLDPVAAQRGVDLVVVAGQADGGVF